MRPIIYFFILFAFSGAAVAQNQLVEILADSLFSSEVNDQTSAATGSPLLISGGSYGGQSFIADTTGVLSRLEIMAKKNGASVSTLSFEIRTGSDPAMGSSLIIESIEILSSGDSIYAIVLTPPIPVTKGDPLVMIVQKTGGGDAEWQRSSTDVYSGGTAFLNASGWLPPLSNQDHWFSSFIEVMDSALVSFFSVDVDGLIKVKNRITNVADPLSSQDAATKAYVDLLESELEALQGVKDIDNNRYDIIAIGTQTWMAENLRVTRYNDGTIIPLVIDNTDWSNLSTPAYTWYNNGPSDYGALYNYFTVADTNSLNVCPTGWHIPTDGEWDVLRDFLDPSANGNNNIAGGKMKETGLAHWFSPNSEATNESAFAGLPGGYRNHFGSFFNIGYIGYCWSSAEFFTADAWYRSLNYNNGIVIRGNHRKESGLSVRCLRD